MTENIENFLLGSKTYEGISFNGSYMMPMEVFIKIYEEFKKTGCNYLDCYSELLYVEWEEEVEKLFYDVEKYNYLNHCASVCRRLKLFDIYRLLDIKRNIRIGYRNYISYREKILNRPRINACKYTSRSDVRDYIFAKHGEKCLCCGSVHGIALDHVIPITKGGKNELDNLQPLCKKCNSKKGTKIIDYRDAN